MATFDTTTLKGKIAAGLDPHRGDEPQSVVEQLARNIAFIIRYKLRPDVAAHEVSVLALTPPSYLNSFMPIRTLLDIVVLVHLGFETVRKVVAVRVQDTENAITQLTTVVDATVRKILSAAAIWTPRNKGIVGEN
ncbi:hypothetical protein HBH56_109280 [Parastagonospora nodorum]|uniref:Uncharacterized protein n=1 Tax=Phaeosphaeria nodorum (strain SN15 / ATCC MYA-4574 / FGSC 10173) TaxID=321614 RepID=A0A7U2I7Z1_PHANO|nr:hypothetical protein HBH56_109280 [Parastagonospora nodorum]QRD03258.1 hypothetical protein JI435_100310 [Parastagonospora nodorum SN15]KAH3922361.1 hypothetical protein HBH54_226380 [Parastagonospora nodorum]KAH3974407.1 hypothetical protein HBH51_093260 [Parastagonospora nodorum]KAH4138667.1 hypothetical protein HBH45_104610 [Parastagonospora nodorum]